MTFKESFDKYIKQYPDSRYYHSEKHIIDMLIDLSTYWTDFKEEFHIEENEEDKLYEILCYAILFHDIVYTVGAKDNEKKSAEFARSVLSDYKYVKDVCNLILSTKINHRKFDTPLKKILHDLDWKGFMFYDDICKNEEKIKTEAIRDGFNENQFVKGQLIFYKKIVKKKLYLTSNFHIFNIKAKRNIQKRIEELEKTNINKMQN